MHLGFRDRCGFSLQFGLSFDWLGCMGLCRDYRLISAETGRALCSGLAGRLAGVVDPDTQAFLLNAVFGSLMLAAQANLRICDNHSFSPRKLAYYIYRHA